MLHDPRRDLVHTGKLLTTPDDPSEAIVDGTQRLLREAGLRPADLHSIVHGTTLVTNTVIERTGASVGLITTAGFRDVHRDRHARSATTSTTCSSKRRRPWCRAIGGAKSRSGSTPTGQVLLPLDEIAVAGVTRAGRERGRRGARDLASCTATAIPQHEQRAGEIVRAALPRRWR